MTQDFSGRNLRGRSFKGQNLEGADFSGADIRGADFTAANLINAKFTGAKAGVQGYWIIGLLIISLLLSGISGFFSIVLGIIVGFSVSNEGVNAIISGIISLFVLLLLCVISLRKGLTTALLVFATPFSATIGVAASIYVGVDITTALAAGVAGAALGTVAFSSAVLGALAVVIAVVTDKAVALAAAVVSSAIVAIAVTIAISATAAKALNVSVPIAFAVTHTLSNIYIGWRNVAQGGKDAWIRSFAIAFAAIRGTRFYKADLTDAKFNQAILKNTDFRKANLTHTCFHQAKKLDFVRPGISYLQNANLRQVLTTGQGQGVNFDREDLRGVNFQKAYLSDASFIAADLSNASFQDADLSRAKLVQTQLDATDFTGANLTGAYIEDWNITSQTNFTDVRCQYIYMRLPTKDNPDPHRKPDNREEMFADGEFGDFIQPIFDTLDLYHSQGVDPRAIAISFKQLAENHPDAELEIVAMEKRGQDKFLLRSKTAPTVDKSQLSAEYFDTYNEIKGLPEREIKLLLAEKDNQIRRLENMVMTALERPSFYSNIQVEEVGTMTNTPGGFSIGGSVGGNVNNVQGVGNRVVQGDTTMTGNRNINTGGGNYNERIQGDYVQGNYYAAGQPQTLAEAAAEIQLLLKQLEQTYPTTTTSQQMVVAAEAINRIESNPTLKKRVINAVKEGGLAAFEKAIDNPAGAFIVGAIKGWQEVEAED
ncbi:pentapeptide repeat-containing protein [Nostoc sp. CCY0012]|uniref:pentapeptide repeat-containing protein n=1 Tax=Nostoc sp. CCY0012 TaxID=1056123 RepID=UPI0039C6C47F